MRPLSPAKYPVNEGFGNAKKAGNLFYSPSRFFKPRNAFYLVVSQLGHWMTLPLRGAPTIRILPPAVFRACHPFQIFGTIIPPITIYVINCIFLAGGRAVERRTYKPMGERTLSDTIAHGFYDSISINSLTLQDFPLGGIPASRADYAPYTPKVGRLKPIGIRNGFPKLLRGAISFISHAAVLSHRDQGRALRQQRFRPVNYGENYPLVQGVVTS